MRHAQICVTLTGLLPATGAATETYGDELPPAGEIPMNVLFIGNGYTSVNDLPNVVQRRLPPVPVAPSRMWPRVRRADARSRNT